MYETKYICTYNSNNVFEESDNVTDSDKEFIVNALYRNDLLYIFNLEDFDIENIIFELIELYEKVKCNDFLISCMRKMGEKFLNMDINMDINMDTNMDKDDTNNINGLIILYSFDYLYLTHPCVSEYLENGFIQEETIKLLKEKVLN
jgi:hypothetical protein